MAEDVGNLAIKLSLDSANFERSMKSIDRNLKAMGQEMRGVQNKGKEWGNSIAGLTTKQDGLTRMLTSQEVKVRQLREAYERSKTETGENSRATENLATQLNRAVAEYNRTETELNQVSAALRRQQDQLRLSQSSWTQLGERMQAVGASMKKVGDSMTNVGKNLSMKVTAPIALMGTGIIKAGMDFEAGMSKVAAVSGATGADLEALKVQAKELGSATSFSASQAAEGMEKLALAGWKANEITAAMPGMLDLAAAGALSLSEAADITSDVMSAFGLSADKAGHAADVFAYAQANANTNVQQAGEAMTYLAPVANALGLELEESAAAIMLLADSGVKGSMAGQAFATSLSRLAKPTKAMNKVTDKLGMSFFDLEGNIKPLPEMMKEIETGTKGMTKEQKSSTLSTLFGAEAYKHWAILLEAGSDKLATTTVELKNADGAAKRMADTMLDNTKGSLVAFQSAVEGLAIQLAEHLLPTITKILDKLTEWSRAFTDVSPDIQKLVLAIAGIAAAIGPVLVVMGVLTSSIGSIISAFGLVSSAIAVMTTGVASAIPGVSTLAGLFTALTGPIGIAVAAIAAIGVGAGVMAYKLSKEAIPEVDRFGKNVSDATQEALGGFFALSDGAGQALMELNIKSGVVGTETKNKLVSTFGEMNTQILDGLKKNHAEQEAEAKKHLDLAFSMSVEEREKVLQNLQKQNESEIKIQEAKEGIVKEIMTKASDERRALTEHEKNVLENINTQMKESAVQVLTDSEVEQKIILERMKSTAGDLTALQAAEVVANSATQRQKVVEEAEEQYKESHAAIIRMRDESGIITAEQATEMIDNAERTRDLVVNQAERMHEQVVTEARSQAEEHVDLVDWETGEVLSKWEVLKNKHADTWNAISDKFSDILNSIKKITKSSFETVKKYVEDSINGILKFVKPELDKLKAFWNENGKAISGFVKLHFNQIKSTIEMVMGVIKGVFQIVWPQISALVKVAWETIKFHVSTGLSLILGIVQTAMKLLQGDWKGAWETIKKTSQTIVDNIVKFFKNVDLLKVGKDIIQGLINGIGSMVDAVKKKVKEIANLIPDGIKKLLNIQSPSRVTKALGGDTVQGLVVGMEEQKGAVTDAVAELGQIMIDVTRKNGEEVNKIAEKAEKDRTAIQQSYATKAENISATNATKRIQLEGDKHTKLAKVNEKAWADMVKKEQEISKQRLEAVKLFVEDKKSLEQLSLVDEVIIWQTAAESFKKGTKEKIESQKAYAKALDEVNKEITSINKNYADQMLKINDDFQKQEEDLTKKYEDTLKARMQSLYNFAGVFDEFDVKVYQSGHVLLNNLEKQVDGFKDWQTTIEKLAKRAIDDGLIAELTAMGPKALGELQALNSLSDDELSKYSSLYQEKSELARTQAEAELIGMKNDTQKQIADLRNIANTELSALQTDWQKEIKAISNGTSKELTSLKKIGEDAVKGLIEGMKKMHPDLKKTADSLAKTVSGTVKSSLQIKSPSRVMMGYGENVAEGLAIGIGNKAKYAADAAKSMVQDLDKMLVDGVRNVNDEIAEIEKRAAEDAIKATEHRYSEIKRISDQYRDYDGKIRKSTGYYDDMDDLDWNTAQELIEIERKKNEEIERLQSTFNTLKLADVKKFFDEKKKSENLSYMDELFFWEETIKLYEDGSEEKAEIQKEYQKVVEQITNEINTINDQHANKVLEINDRLKKDTEDLTAAYTKSVDDRANSLASFAGIFDEFKVNQEKSGEDLLANLKGQVDGFKSWQENIADLSARAIDEGLMAELRAMGPKAAGELEALNKMTDAQLEEYSKLYQEKQALARQQAEQELIGMKGDTEKRIDELRNAANAELDVLEKDWVTKIQSVTKATDDELKGLKDVGKQAGQGLLDGLASMEGALVSKAQSIAEAVKSAMAGAFDIHSPSRWMRDMIGKNMMVGWMDGMESMKSKVLAVANASTDWMTPNVPDLSAYATPQHAGGYGGGSSTTNNNNRSYTGNTTVNVYAPTASPSEIARKSKQAQRQMAMEWGV